MLVVSERGVERERDVVRRVHAASRDEPARVRRVEERRRLRLRVVENLLGDSARMRVAEADEHPVGEEVFSRRGKRLLQNRDLLEEVDAEVLLRARCELREVLESDADGIPWALPPDAGLWVEARLRELLHGVVPDARLVHHDVYVVRLVLSSKGESDFEDVVQLHHVPVVVRNAVRDLDVRPLPERGLVLLRMIGEARVELADLVDDVVVDRLHRLHSE